MGQHKLSEGARFLNKIDFIRRLYVVGAAIKASPAKFTPSPAKPRLSTRGQRKPTWYTKKWTSARLRDRDEARSIALGMI